ncbi:MAG: class I SAM-dependent methyltransferase [Cocleimonas sp.]|nr:class I SAM-dependent methyltransferase [Sulfurovaceae bacterium]MCK5917018.1 class I SAM-dependent methyltransferase [Cocleimonas sp.]
MAENKAQNYKEQGIKSLAASDYHAAIEYFKKRLKQPCDDIDVFDKLGDAYIAIGDKNSAASSYTSALEIAPKHTTISLKLSRALLVGMDYIQALGAIHKALQPESYIEIGVCKGVSFALADSDIIAIGVDPEPQLDLDTLPEKHSVISDTSDNYFSSGRIQEDLNGGSFDMAFLDGMHLFEYALRDFMNLERYASPDSIVFIHDLYPLNAETAARERFADFWSGDVWKLALCLQEYRPDLNYSLLPCPPTGLGVVTGLNASSTVLQDNYNEILEKYMKMPYSVLDDDKSKKLSLASTDHPLLIN